ncbi:membrane-bound PQQ-dependent dehydrogenase, glucose/quinate/shikimate family [Altererythrobacter xixiisoli]|uniref:Membrane-bound PQQ-dependent dehydrogenase, glucose/quinate/shikimate family n=1 Tax=Croceibacterium xixiisoli TaxID=1476466 RepID=A0A6I4TQZ9_9SPHN|nr:membrane-bound PQQ-dependent dehydrogenase, glucose/quinate/shikimate family [Croceibacterium xixiisoli]MXO98336.1 membrane-bound PQQ-dependent dehydrogenase, glucose/quinate/shikimate family [Croceibacterium xixiisoli]
MDKTTSRGRIILAVFGVVLVLLGLPLTWGGVQLATLGGSWYYLFAGLALIVSGVLIARRRLAGAAVFAVLFAVTIAWSLWEAGLDFWPLVPRVSGPLFMAFLLLLLLPRFPGWTQGAKAPLAMAGLTALLMGGAVALALQPKHVTRHDFTQAVPGKVSAETLAAGNEWREYAHTGKGTRYITADQITPDNVRNLKVAWEFDYGEAPAAATLAEDQNTPTYANGVLYSCTPSNTVNALDAQTGKLLWSYAAKGASPIWQRCRGVTYYEAQPAAGQPPAGQSVGNPPATGGACQARIVMNAIDGRLIELDAATGKPCADFGDNGVVNLNADIGETPPAMYIPTSAPTVMQDKIVVGGWIFDGQKVGEPSGVVRAFDARSGELVWAWDMGKPDVTKLPPAGETYTLGTPNIWSTPAYDLELGLIYLPTGNSTPDFWGAHRRDFDEKYGSSVVALDIATGRERWHFQTVHHDVWDYDVPSQPALYDIPDGRGGTIPALIQTTKQGQIFVLDRRTGQPITKVEERPVPQGAAPGDFLSPTQPFSVGMPQLGVDTLSEAKMWGVSMFDQLYCRIRYRSMRYEGMYTPPGTDTSLMFPSPFGGMNWGSASIDEGRGLLIVNDMRIPRYVKLIPRAIADTMQGGIHGAGIFPQAGTPFAIETDNVMSPLGIPCMEPPFGTMTAIDLNTKKIVWQVPMGTVKDTRLFGTLKVGLPLPIGMPTVGGALTTASGLTFYSGTQDFALRALDTTSGREIWKADLPVGAQMTPMSYIAPNGKQYIVVSAGGARESPIRGSKVIAYALPD